MSWGPYKQTALHFIPAVPKATRCQAPAPTKPHESRLHSGGHHLPVTRYGRPHSGQCPPICPAHPQTPTRFLCPLQKLGVRRPHVPPALLPVKAREATRAIVKGDFWKPCFSHGFPPGRHCQATELVTARAPSSREGGQCEARGLPGTEGPCNPSAPPLGPSRSEGTP